MWNHVLWLAMLVLAGCGGALPGLPTGSEASPANNAEAQPAEVAVPVAPSLDSTRPGEDWPQFLGPRDDGTSAETGLLKEWPAGGPPQLWHAKLGEGYAPASVRGERVIVQHRQRDQEIVECFHAETGDSLWKYAYDTDFTDPYGYDGGTRCAPVLSAHTPTRSDRRASCCV